jgi:primosomal protein N' (replication factor Y) (superfamily II helicase)
MQTSDSAAPVTSVLYAAVLVPRAYAGGNTSSISVFFTYTVPPEMASAACPGVSVLVPFGLRLTLGIIWQSPTTEVPTTISSDAIRPIHEILDPHPLLDYQHRALAEWMADAYCCSLGEAVRLMLPGLTGTPRINLVIAPQLGDSAPLETPADDRETRALLGMLRARGSIDEAVIRRALGARKGGQVIADLEARGALIRALHAQSVSVDNNEPQIQLAADAGTIAVWKAGTLPASKPRRMVSSHASAAARARRNRGMFLRDFGATAEASPAVPPAQGRDAARIRAAHAILDLLLSDPSMQRSRREVLRLAHATPAALTIVEQAGLVRIVLPDMPAVGGPRPAQPITGLALSTAQQSALDQITAAMDASLERILIPSSLPVPDDLQQASRPILLHGITGSGKTEVYLQALAAALECGRRGIVLVPEIALTPQTVSRFAKRFPGRVALLHSALKPAERQREWRRIRSGEVDVVIGSRSAIFAPLPDLGLIILDEEHDSSYKHEQRLPTYHAREVAVALGRITGAAVVFGSATPSTETYFHASRGEYALAELPERAVIGGKAAALPEVTVVDLREELHAGHMSILSRELLAALDTTLERGEQSILYLNRRGTATCVICRDCGYVVRCGRCDVALTHHAHQDMLICHHCNWRERPPVHCLNCGGDGIRFFGVGTERVEATVRERYPHARVLRWDADTIHAYTDHERFGQALANQQVDIMIGTQMIAKGLDVPGVTLVGVIAADVALFLPDYRAAERSFQLLSQVAGRAGRGTIPGRVIMQTFSPDHFCIDAAAHHAFRAFYDTEIVTRQAYGYPPFRRFVKLTYSHKDRHACQLEAISLGDHLARLIAELDLPDTDIVGPAPAFIERLRGVYRWQLILRGPDPRTIIQAMAPGELGDGWMVDIDPLSSL